MTQGRSVRRLGCRELHPALSFAAWLPHTWCSVATPQQGLNVQACSPLVAERPPMVDVDSLVHGPQLTRLLIHANRLVCRFGQYGCPGAVTISVSSEPSSYALVDVSWS